jgi:hypothetical protein
MTLIYQAQNLSPKDPQTHALVIGVGRYPHLSKVDARLKPLTSPAISAKAFAHWLVNTPLTNPAAPLGTVELLLSPLNPADQQYELPDESTVAIDSASLPNIRRSFEAWFNRCNTLKGNVALFYFCGHGLHKATLALLPENFGQNSSNEWADTINFEATFEGMRSTCQAQTQCYIIDACRQVDIASLRTSAFGGQALGKNDALSRNNPATLKIFATGVGEPAFGEENQVSRLTSVLLQALQSSNRPDGIIDLGGLAETVRRLMEQTNQNLPPGKQQFAMPESVGNAAAPIHFMDPNTPPPPPPLPDKISSLSAEEAAHLQELLEQHQQNLRYLEQQSAVFGAGEKPLHLLNQIETEKKEIDQLKAKLNG